MERIATVKRIALKHPTYFVIAALLILAALLRSPYLGTIPPWYTDEGFYLQMSWNVIHGQFQTFGIGDWSFISPLFTAPPLFLSFIGLLLIVFGKSFLVFRVVSVIFALSTIFSLWYIGSRWTSKWMALLPAAAYTFIPIVIINNRWGLPQNAAGFFLLWAFYFLITYTQHKKRRGLWFSILFYVFALGTTYWAGFFVIAYIIALYKTMKWKSLLVAAGAVVPIAVMLVIRAVSIPTIFFQDLQHLLALFTYQSADSGGTAQTADAAKSASPLVIVFIVVLYKFLRISIIFVFSLLGLIFLKKSTMKTTLWVALLVLAFPILTFRPTPEGWFYPQLIFLPLLLLGLTGYNFKDKNYVLNGLKISAIGVITMCIIYFGFFSARYLYSNQLTRAATIQRATFIYSPDTEYMKDAFLYMQGHTTKDDFIIAPHIIGAQLEAAYAPPVWVACYEFKDEFSFLPSERFLRHIGISDAKYFVDDLLFSGDVGICQGYRDEVYDLFYEQQWPIVYKNPRFIIYKNPALNFGE